MAATSGAVFVWVYTVFIFFTKVVFWDFFAFLYYSKETAEELTSTVEIYPDIRNKR